MDPRVIVICIFFTNLCSARVVPNSFRLNDIYSLNMENKIDEEADLSVIKVPVQKVPNGVVEDVENSDFSGDMEDLSKNMSREMDFSEIEYSSHAQMLSSDATQKVENPLDIDIKNGTYLNTSHTNFSGNSEAFLSSFESHMNFSNIHVTRMNSTDLIFSSIAFDDLQQNFTTEEMVTDWTLLKQNDTLSFDNSSDFSKDKLNVLIFETQSENSFNQTDLSDTASVNKVTNLFGTNSLFDKVNSTNVLGESKIFVNEKEVENTTALKNQLVESAVYHKKQREFDSISSEVTKNAVFNFSDSSLTDHLIGEGEFHDILDLVLPRHENDNSGQVLLNVEKENSHPQLTKNNEAEINETLLLNMTDTLNKSSGHPKNSQCPPPGVCLFWFFSQDECADDHHCLGNRICCRVRCVKTCVEI